MYRYERDRWVDQLRASRINEMRRLNAQRDHFAAIGFAPEYVAERCSEELAGLVELNRLEQGLSLMTRALELERATSSRKSRVTRAPLRLVKS